MLLKTLGIALVVAGCGSWGLTGAKQIRQRVEQLRDLRLALSFLEKDISYMYVPLTKALENAGHFAVQPVAAFFLKAAQVLREQSGVTAAEAWQEGVKALQAVSALKQPELYLLSSIASQIGISDGEEQRKCLDLIIEQLKLLEEKNRENLDSGQKLWTYGGFILGITLVLLLI